MTGPHPLTLCRFPLGILVNLHCLFLVLFVPQPGVSLLATSLPPAALSSPSAVSHRIVFLDSAPTGL